MSEWRAGTLLLILAVGLAGCRDSGTAGQPAAVRDSAGITIVESSAPAWSNATGWRVDSVPTFDVGGSESDTAPQFFNIRGAHRLSDGGVVVLDAASLSLRFFDSLGASIGSAGGKGSGPGEFPRWDAIRSSFACGTDTVYVYASSRVQVYAAAKFVRQFTFDQQRLEPIACRDNRIVARQWIGTWPTTGGLHPDTVVLAWYDMEGKSVATIDTLQNRDRLFGESGPEGRGYFLPPYGRRLSVALGPHGVATGDGERFDITYRDDRGTVRRIARVDTAAIPMQPVTDADVERYKAFVLSNFGGNPTEKQRIEAYNKKSFRPTAPAFVRAIGDAEGNLWLREHDWADVVEFFDRVFGRAGVTRAVRMDNRGWVVLDPDGRLLGRIKLPMRFEVSEIGPDWVLGVWRDELDVEHVRLYRVVKR